MIPENLNARRGTTLTTPRAMKRDFSSRSTGRTATLFAAMRRVACVLSVWQKQVMRQRTFASLDDYLLCDIGLARGNVEQELMKPFWWT